MTENKPQKFAHSPFLPAVPEGNAGLGTVGFVVLVLLVLLLLVLLLGDFQTKVEIAKIQTSKNSKT